MLKLKNISHAELFAYAVLLFAFVLPLSRAAISLFVIVIPFLWFYKINIANIFQKILNNQSLMLLIVFVGLMLLSVLWVDSLSGQTKRELRLLLYYLTIFAIATFLLPKYTQKIITAFLAGLFISEIISYGVFFKLWQFKHATPQDPTPFMNHLDYSVFLAFGSILLLHRILGHYKLKEKFFYSLFFLSVTGNLFITGGRTGQIALMVGLVVLSFIHFKMRLKTFLMAMGLIIAIFGSAYILSSTFHTRVAQAKSDITGIIVDKNYKTSWGIRIAYWIVGSEAIKQNPLFGTGISGYRYALSKILQKKENKNKYDIAFMKKHTPHNQYLLILLDFGIIGFGLFIYFIYSFFTMPIKSKELKELSILFGTIFFVSLVADTFLLDQFTLALFCLFGGLFMANVRNSEVFCEN